MFPLHLLDVQARNHRVGVGSCWNWSRVHASHVFNLLLSFVFDSVVCSFDIVSGL